MNKTNYIKEYYGKIDKGEIVASKRVKAIYKRLVEEIDNPGKYHFDIRKAQRPIDFIQRFCKQSKGDWYGKPIRLLLFQKAFIQALYGFVDDKGIRKYKEAFFLVARKNGKSTLLAGLALYNLMCDEKGACCYSLATKRDQAKIVFNEALNMVSQSPELKKLLKKRKSDLYFPHTMSVFEPLGKNYDSLDGLNASFAIIDEAHALKGTQGRELYEVIKQSQSSRKSPLLITITTSGSVIDGIYDQLYEYSTKICDGIIKDDTFLPIIYELDNKDEWRDPKNWEKANPAIGVIKKVEDIKEKCERVKSDPKFLSGFLCKDMNVKSTVAETWLTFDQLNNEEVVDFNSFRGAYFLGGADLSRTTDLTCATVMICGKNKRYVTQMYFLPEDTYYEYIKDKKIPYDIWKEQGLLRLCPGNQIDYSYVTQYFLEMINKYELTPYGIFYDSWSSQYWTKEMEAYGFPMYKVIQGMKTLSLPMQALGADLSAKKVIYQNNPLLKWCISNVTCKQDINGNIQPCKLTNPRMRIDGLASLLDAYVGYVEHGQELEQGGLLYEE